MSVYSRCLVRSQETRLKRLSRFPHQGLRVTVSVDVMSVEAALVHSRQLLFAFVQQKRADARNGH
jgi:hypothetical protein